MDWILANMRLVLEIVAVVVAILYAAYTKKLLPLIAEVWALIVACAKGNIVGIPDAFLEQVAHEIHDVLPSWLKLVVSVSVIRDVLIRLRDSLVADTGQMFEAAVTHKQRAVMMRAVRDKLQA